MRRLFGEYLVEKNVVSAESLVDALIEQQREVPSACEVARRRNLLAPEQILAVLGRQAREGGDFVAHCRAAGFWDAEKESLLKSEQDQRRTPIGQVLLRKGAAELEALIHAFDEYAGSEIGAEVTGGATQSEPAPAETAVSPARPPAVDPDALREILDLYTSEKKAELEAALAGDLEGLFHELHRLRGAFRYYRLKAGEVITSSLEILCGRTIKAAKNNPGAAASARASFADVARLALSALWGIRESLAAGNGEEGWLRDNAAVFEKIKEGLHAANSGGG